MRRDSRRFTGRFLPGIQKHQQTLSFGAGGSSIFIGDYSSRKKKPDYPYFEPNPPLLQGWMDPNDWRCIGNFKRMGIQQVMFFNRTNAGDGRVMVADFSNGAPPMKVRYWENWGDSSLLDGWLDDNDDPLAGNFLGLDHDQVMFFNRTNNGDGRLMVADFLNDGPPAAVRYWENWGDSPLLDGWMDDNDLCVPGRFCRLTNRTQLMLFNRTNAGDGRVMVIEVSGSKPPVAVRYLQNWGDSPLLDGWLDSHEEPLVGDFCGKGYHQVMFFNRVNNGAGRVMIVDFGVSIDDYSAHKPPPQVLYLESWGDNPLLDGWLDDNDDRIVGRLFDDSKHDQVLFINGTNSNDGHAMVLDFSNGSPPAQVFYLDYWKDM